ncbi:unnamed protein product [Parascedosporium putredinis]|uniref:ER membrane protein complex subunit 7 beta-sandwich domain-containing protein n=1 Tax=Parascedosporium putredinis TaxID=1442378 RepID=A0A9P1H9W7_9PEZI|nr:unnamed protein product [Parascedosporium putredinis]CAI8001261.1 unnamed protein product [Parascedosporium putredinis]
MRLLSLSGLAALLPLTASAATVTLYVGPSHHLSGNGAGQASLPSRTHATLSALGAQYTAHLTPSGEFVFRNVSGVLSIFSILKNPMILLGLVSMGLFVGMPYLVDNMDPEMKAEFEERQKSSPMNNLLAGQASGGNPMGNFDMAAFLAGSNKKEGSGRGADDGVVRR